MLKKQYTNSCDLWQCGVFLFLMVTGDLPFTGKSEEELRKNIMNCSYDISNDDYKKVSQEIKDLIKKLLCPESERLTAKQVQQDPWLLSNSLKSTSQQKETESEQKVKSQLLTSLKKFQTKSELHQAVLAYITSQLTAKEDQLHFKRIFSSFDKNNDGTLSKVEIETGLKDSIIFQSKNIQFDEIFLKIDSDKNDKINYSEFIVACSDLEMSKLGEKLKLTFEAFDSNGDNYISADELTRLFSTSPSKNDQGIKQILQEADLNSDQKISFEEFKEMMKKYSTRTS